MFALWDHTYRRWFASLEKQRIRCRQGLISVREPPGEMAFASFEPPVARGSVLLFHGTGNDALFGWNFWIEGLLERGLRVLAVDLDGHGHASNTTLSHESFAESMREINTWLLVEGWSKDSVSICAYSLGGLYALEAIARGHIAPDRLVLLALPLTIDLSLRFFWAEAMTAFHPMFWRHIFAFGWRASIPAFGTWRREAYPVRLKDHDDLSYPQAIAALFKARNPLTRAAICRSPTLLIHGSEDYLAPADAGYKLKEVLSQSALCVIPKANHFLLPWFPSSLKAGLDWLSLSNVALS